MTSRISRRGLIAAFLLGSLLVIAGCGRKTASNGASSESGDVSLKSGSSIVLTQTIVPFEGRFEIVPPDHDVRTVKIKIFEPAAGGELSWSLRQLVETDESKAARADAQSKGGTVPDSKYGELIGQGTLVKVNVRNVHDVGLPAAWPVGDAETGTSALWVSNDVYQELSRTKVSTIYLHALEAADKAVMGDAELQNDLKGTISAIQARISAISSRTDVDLMKAEAEDVAWPITINGKQTTVRAIKANGWYGTLVVLDDPKNPLILSFDFNPPSEGLSVDQTKMDALKGLLSFKVTEIK